MDLPSGVINHGWLENPLSRFIVRNITYFYGPNFPARHVWLAEGSYVYLSGCALWQTSTFETGSLFELSLSWEVCWCKCVQYRPVTKSIRTPRCVFLCFSRVLFSPPPKQWHHHWYPTWNRIIYHKPSSKPPKIGATYHSHMENFWLC